MRIRVSEDLVRFVLLIGLAVLPLTAVGRAVSERHISRRHGLRLLDSFGAVNYAWPRRKDERIEAQLPQSAALRKRILQIPERGWIQSRNRFPMR